jgi:hypothetical protein
MNTNSKSTKYWRIKLIKKKKAKDNSIERKKKLEDGIKKKGNYLSLLLNLT